MSFIQPWLLWALPLIGLPILIHLINQWRYQTRRWAPMMFLLQASRMNRGLARVRQWLILALRTLAILAFILGICRPLASGFWSLLGTNQPDATIVLMDRSPSMGERGMGTDSKLQAGKRQLQDALRTIGSTRWVAVDAGTGQSREFPTLDALIDAREMQPSSASSTFPAMLQTALDYTVTNQLGSADIWICSDLQVTDWNPDSGQWSLVRSGFQSIPQRVRFSLLAYPESSPDNLAIRVTDAFCQPLTDGNRTQHALNLSLRITRTNPADAAGSDLAAGQATRVESTAKQIVPVELELAGAVSQLQVELAGNSAELRDHRITLPSEVTSGWGRVSIPADSNPDDNDFYFVFDSSPDRRIVLVSDNRSESRPLEIAASLSADGQQAAEIDVLSPDQLSSPGLEGASLLIWHAEMPGATAAAMLDPYVDGGGQILFFPPPSLSARSPTHQSAAEASHYRGVRWKDWVKGDAQPTRVIQWRGDQDLLAATQSGAGLPVGQLEIHGFARLSSEQPLTELATLESGDSLLSRLPTNAGGIYFFGASPASDQSSLARDGVVLFVIIQRAIEQGQSVIRGMKMRDAGFNSADIPAENFAEASEEEPDENLVTEPATPPTTGSDPNAALATSDWTKVAGPANVPSTEFPYQAGVYQRANQLFAVNRPLGEDRGNRLSREGVDQLFSELPLRHISLQTGASSSIVNEIWRPLLYLVLLFLLLEAILCVPKPAGATPLTSRSFAQSKS